MSAIVAEPDPRLAYMDARAGQPDNYDSIRTAFASAGVPMDEWPTRHPFPTHDYGDVRPPLNAPKAPVISQEIGR